MAGPAVPAFGNPGPTLWYGGDSISNGFLCPGCTVAQRLFAKAAGLRILPSSKGLNGRTFAQFSRESDIPQASVIVVELGTNDFGQGVRLPALEASAGELLDRIRAINPNSALFCLGVSSLQHRTNDLGLRLADYDRVIQRECVRRNGVFVGIAAALEKAPGAFHADEVHITQAGHEVLSALLLRAFERLKEPRPATS